eukprot:699397-Rhodomonas_salina.1
MKGGSASTNRGIVDTDADGGIATIRGDTGSAKGSYLRKNGSSTHKWRHHEHKQRRCRHKRMHLGRKWRQTSSDDQGGVGQHPLLDCLVPAWAASVPDIA